MGAAQPISDLNIYFFSRSTYLWSRFGGNRIRIQTFTHIYSKPSIPSRYIDYNIVSIIEGKSFLGYFYSNHMIPLFCHFQKKGPRPKWTIYKNVSGNSMNCGLSVILEFCLQFVVCSLQHVCSLHQLIQRPEIFSKRKVYHPKLSKCSQIYDFETLCLDRAKALTNV